MAKIILIMNLFLS